jgi:hypothetical protein
MHVMIKGLSMNSVVCTRRFLQGTAMFNNQYNNKIPKAINTITNYRKPISATYTRTKTSHKHRGICCLLSLVKTCLIHYSIIFNLTTVNVPRIENIIFFNLQKKTFPFRCVWYLVVPQTGNQSCVHIHPLLFQY